MHRGLLLCVLLCGMFMYTAAQRHPAGLKKELLQHIIDKRMQLTREHRTRTKLLPRIRSQAVTKTAGRDGFENYPVSEPIFVESEVHAAVDPQDENMIVVSAIRQVRMEGHIYDLTCPVYSTTDGGYSWTEAPFITDFSEPDGIIYGGGDPVLAFDNNGTAYFSWLYAFLTPDYTHLISELYWAYSNDGGYTWILPEHHVFARADYYNPEVGVSFVDKQWLATDNSNSVHTGNLYAAYVRIANDIYSIRVARKAAAADAFDPVEAVISPPELSIVQFASIAVDPDGGVHVIFFGSADEEQFSLWHARSDDGGKSFSAAKSFVPVIIPRFSLVDKFGQIAGTPGDRVYPCPQLAADPSRPGYLYVTWTATGLHEKSTTGADIYFSRSTDYGVTWSEPVYVNDDDTSPARDQYYSSIAVNSSGTIVLTWYDMREDEEKKLGRYYFAVSRDGGFSFSRSEPVATMPMDMWKTQSKNDGFGIGEYTQVLITDTHILPFWTDGRTNNGYTQVYGALIGLSTLDVEQHSPVESSFRILDAWPEPLASEATIRFSLDRPMTVRFVLTDLLGRRVRSGSDQQFESGTHEYRLHAEQLAPGAYYLLMQTDAGSAGRLLRVLPRTAR